MQLLRNSSLKRNILLLLPLLFLVGCGSDTTYVQEAPLLPETPTDGTNIIVSAEGESSAGVQYTEVGDGSILVSCGDDCSLSIYEATKLDSNTTEG